MKKNIYGIADIKPLEGYIIANFYNAKNIIVKLKLGNYEREFPLLRGYLNLRIYKRLNEMGVADEVIMDNLFTAKGDTKSTIAYINRLSNIFDDEENKRTINQFVVNCILKTSQFAENRISYDISYFDIFAVTAKDPEAHKIIVEGGLVNESMSPYEIMTIKNDVYSKLIDIVNRHKLEPFYTFINSGSCMRIPQFVDCFGLIGAKPADELVIPYVVETSWFRGIRNIKEHYVESQVARFAKISEKCKISETGTALKDSMFINKDVPVVKGDCGTVHLLPVFFNDLLDIKAHMGMYYSDRPNVHKYKKLDKVDKDLIGKVLYFRTPATCAHIDGALCSTCVGVNTLAKFDLGLDCSLKIMGDSGQIMLSAKHIMILLAAKHLEESMLEYLNNTIRNKLKVTDKVKSVYLSNYESDGFVATSNNLLIETIDGVEIEVRIMDTYVSVRTTNLENRYVINLDDITIANKNRPKSKVFYILTRDVFSSVSEKRAYTDTINIAYNACRDNYHAVQIYTILHKHLRNPNNLYERFDFRDPNKTFNDGIFISMDKMLKYLPFNDSLQHGRKVMHDVLLSPETYLGERPKSDTMDVILIPRRTEDLKRIIDEMREE